METVLTLVEYHLSYLVLFGLDHEFLHNPPLIAFLPIQHMLDPNIVLEFQVIFGDLYYQNTFLCLHF